MNYSRRKLLWTTLTGVGWSSLSQGLQGAAAVLTPAQSRGPFYPDEIPLDSDNDLITVEGRDQIAAGEISNVLGRVLDENGRAIPNAVVEIWQCNAWGRYHHPRDHQSQPVDPNFQGYGAMITGEQGKYRFRTIKPVSYPGRAPHIHFAVTRPGAPVLVTQLYVEGEPDNDGDFLLSRVRDLEQRQSILVPFEPDPDQPEVLLAVFDIVLPAS